MGHFGGLNMRLNVYSKHLFFYPIYSLWQQNVCNRPSHVVINDLIE